MATVRDRPAHNDGMDIAVLPIDDGSSLVLVGTATDERSDDRSAGALVLGPVIDFLEQLAVGGAIMGITGNASYDLLKMLRTQLQQGGILTRKAVVDIDDVRERVADVLRRAGHPGAAFDEITLQAGQGWDVRGTVAAGAFTARADLDGQVFQIRVL